MAVVVRVRPSASASANVVMMSSADNIDYVRFGWEASEAVSYEIPALG
jgi:hypothetical protein